VLQVVQVRAVLQHGLGVRVRRGAPRSGGVRWCCCSRCYLAVWT